MELNIQPKGTSERPPVRADIEEKSRKPQKTAAQDDRHGAAVDIRLSEDAQRVQGAQATDARHDTAPSPRDKQIARQIAEDRPQNAERPDPSEDSRAAEDGRRAGNEAYARDTRGADDQELHRQETRVLEQAKASADEKINGLIE